MSDFYRKHSLILSEGFWCMEKSKNLKKKHFITVQINSFSYKGLTIETRFFLDFKRSNSKRLFLNDSKCKTITRG